MSLYKARFEEAFNCKLPYSEEEFDKIVKDGFKRFDKEIASTYQDMANCDGDLSKLWSHKS